MVINKDIDANDSLGYSESQITKSEISNADQFVEIKKRKCLFRTHGQNKIKWDLFIMLLATINCFQVPYNVAFADSDDSNIYLDIFNGFIDVFFILDVIVNFRTSFIKEATGEEILDQKLIAYNYIKGRFWIDFIASIPVDILGYFLIQDSGNSWTLELASLLKLVRILRLSRLITYLNLKNDLRMSLKLIKLIFYLILYIHILACTWYFIVQQDKEWIPPVDYVLITTNLYTFSSFHQY